MLFDRILVYDNIGSIMLEPNDIQHRE